MKMGADSIVIFSRFAVYRDHGFEDLNEVYTISDGEIQIQGRHDIEKPDGLITFQEDGMSFIVFFRLEDLHLLTQGMKEMIRMQFEDDKDE